MLTALHDLSLDDAGLDLMIRESEEPVVVLFGDT